MNKALIVGINEYSFSKLKSSVNDAKRMAEVLSTHENGDRNFDVKMLLDQYATKANVLKELNNLLTDKNVNTALFYFSGHGFDNDIDGSIVTYDATSTDPGITLKIILEMVFKSEIRNKIIILDSCYSGRFGEYGVIGDSSLLPEGTTILTATGRGKEAFEVNGNSVFTNLLIEALIGGASDILGRVTPANVYSYIDQALSSWEQRPLFKTNVSRFVVLRKNLENIKLNDMRKITSLFPTNNYKYKLNPSYEYTNVQYGKHYNISPYAIDTNVEKFKILQKYNRFGLVVPVGADHMYDAAMKTKQCELTPLGKHYWHLVNANLI